MNIEHIINQSLKYIAKATDNDFIDVRQMYDKELGKQQYRYVYKNKHFETDTEKEQMQYKSLSIIGRYYRRYYGVKNKGGRI